MLLRANVVVCGVPSNGLVAYYPFNGNANDESGNGNNGVVYGATLVPDRFGNSNRAYYFNGTNNYIVTNSDTGLPRGYVQFTISVWISLAQNLINYGFYTQSDCSGPIYSIGGIWFMFGYNPPDQYKPSPTCYAEFSFWNFPYNDLFCSYLNLNGSIQ
jgi:hypothetical protein